MKIERNVCESSYLYAHGERLSRFMGMLFLLTVCRRPDGQLRF